VELTFTQAAEYVTTCRQPGTAPSAAVISVVPHALPTPGMVDD
jgi:hypothetical protein